MNSNLRSISRSFASGFKSVEASAANMATDKNVLYIMLVIAFVNVLGYLMMGNFEAVVFFAIVAYLSTFFTKNMVIVFLISILATNFLMVSKVNYFRSTSKEGMENPDPAVDAAKDAAKVAVKDVVKKEHAKKKDAATASPSPSPSPSAKPSPKPTNKASNTDKKKKEGMNGKLAPAKFNNDDDDDDDDVADSAPFASSSKSIEQAHDNLQKIGGMSSQTEEVMKQQKILMDNMKTMQPFLETAERFLDKFNMKGIDGLLGKIGLSSSDTNANANANVNASS
jgi:hypothetical protein